MYVRLIKEKTMAKIFAELGISATGKVLSLSDFKLFRELEGICLDPEKMKSVTSRAEDYLNKELKVIPLSKFRAYLGEGSVSAYGTPFYDRLNMLINLALAEKHEGKGRFTEKLCDCLWAMLEETTWVIPEHTTHVPATMGTLVSVPPVVGEKNLHGLELGAIYRAATIALVCSLLPDELDSVSPIIRERAIYQLKDRIIKPYVNSRFWWSGDFGNRVNNWCPWNVSNILLVTALVEEDTTLREKIVGRALSHLDNFTNQYKSDGGCDEGPTYWSAAAGSLFDCLELLTDMTDGAIDVYSHPLVRAMGEYEPRMNICGTRFVNFADGGATVHPDGAMLRRYGERCGSDILTSFGDVMSSYGDVFCSPSHPYRTLRNLVTPRQKWDEVVPRAAKKSYFSDLKVMILRESEDPREGLFLAVKGGHNNESHNHNDVGSFVVYYGGEPVLIDAGVGAYTRQTFSSDRYKIWSMQSNYHNLPIINGEGQRAGAQYASCDEVYDEDTASLTMQLSEAYPSEAGVESFVRTAALSNGAVTVTDSIVLSGDGEVDFIFLTHRRPELSEKGKITLNAGRVLNYPPEMTAEIEEFDPVGMNTVAAWGTEKLFRIHLRVTVLTGEFNFRLE